ncbi:MAG TPA: hypothetical protein VF103_13595 [Polyangiaceae bacterium]
MGALSSRQLLWAGSVLFALGALILSRGGLFGGLVLCGIGAVMVGKRFFVS